MHCFSQDSQLPPLNTLLYTSLTTLLAVVEGHERHKELGPIEAVMQGHGVAESEERLFLRRASLVCVPTLTNSVGTILSHRESYYGERNNTVSTNSLQQNLNRLCNHPLGLLERSTVYGKQSTDRTTVNVSRRLKTHLHPQSPPSFFCLQY